MVAVVRGRRLFQPVEAVEGGRLVAFGQRRIVEQRIHEVIDGALVGHNGLADMDQVRCALAEDADPEDLAGLDVEHDLQHAGVVADDLAAGEACA